MVTQRDLAKRVVFGDGMPALRRALLQIIGRRDPLSDGQSLIVVPSRAMRRALLDDLLCHAPQACVGTHVLTLAGLAREVLLRGGRPLSEDPGLFSIAVRHAVLGHRELAELVAPFEDGASLASEAVSDLLSAGVAAVERPADESPRVAALLSASREVAQLLRRNQLYRSQDLLAEAAALLCANPGLLGVNAAFVIGFDDATGQGASLLRALIESTETVAVFFDRPADPIAEADVDRGSVFAERFAEQLIGDRDDWSSVHVARTERATLSCFDAPGLEAEVREVAHRCAEALANGVAPTRIAIIARDLAPYALDLRYQLVARGVPFSGGVLSPQVLPQSRVIRALAALIGEGERCSVAALVDLCADARLHADLKLALQTMGVVELDELAKIDFADLGDHYPLPLCSRLVADGDLVRVQRRSLPTTELGRVQRLAIELLAAWQALMANTQRAPIAEHLNGLNRLLGLIGGAALDDWGSLMQQAQQALGLAADFVVERREFARLLRAQLEGALAAPLGEDQDGVQLLDVANARGLVFDQVFLLGMNRDRFPRLIHSDPLLDEQARARLQRQLPLLRQKREGHDEERLLFAQLLAATKQQVTLSWQRTDDDGRSVAPSVFVERLLSAKKIEPPSHLPRSPLVALTPPFSGGRRPRTARELLWLAGLWGWRDARLFSAAYRSIGQDSASAAVLAAARLELLAQFEPELHQPAASSPDVEPAPFFGLVGSSAVDESRARNPVFVTSLEAIARCPWQAFLTRVLRVSPLPDPVSSLPLIDARLIGEVAHRVLEDVIGASLARRRRRFDPQAESIAVPRPSSERVQHSLANHARAVATEEGILLPGLWRALAERARGFVGRALDLDWPLARSVVEVVGCEQELHISLVDPAGGTLRLAAKADRIDRRGGRLLVTDYKTGRPISRAKRASTRARQLARDVAEGRRLQTALYAKAAGDGVGRFLFINPELDIELSSAELDADQRPVLDDFVRVCRTLAAAWHAGICFPRLEDAGGREPANCRYCRVSEACLRGDSSARRRLVAFAEQAGPSTTARLWSDLWFLGEQADQAERG